MEILLLVAIMVVAASCLFVAATFNKRTKQNTTPLIDDAVKDIVERIDRPTENLRQQLQPITNELRKDRERTTRDRSEIQGRLDLADSQISSISSQFLAARETFERLGQQIDTRHGDLSTDLRQLDHRVAQLRETFERLGQQIDARQGDLSRDLRQLDHRVTQLHESVAQQSARVIAIHRYPQSQETQNGSPPETDSLVVAMLEAEAHTDRQGWGGPPHLYALTEIRDARSDAMTLVEQEQLPDGDLVEALAAIHWPDDVVGCVLVAELTALPPRSEEDAPIIPVADDQWASTHPDGRPARLAVGVHKNGAHTCGLHIKGEDNVQVGTERADDLVTALLGTF